MHTGKFMCAHTYKICTFTHAYRIHKTHTEVRIIYAHMHIDRHMHTSKKKSKVLTNHSSFRPTPYTNCSTHPWKQREGGHNLGGPS